MGARGSEQQHGLRRSSRSAGKHPHSTTKGIRKGRNITVLDNISTSQHVLFCAISSDCRPRKGFLQHGLYHLTDWVHHLSGPDCHISLRCHHWRLSCHVSVPGEGGTDVKMFAKEEGVIALSACHHYVHTEFSCSPSSPYLQRSGWIGLRTKKSRLLLFLHHCSLHHQGCRCICVCVVQKLLKWDVRF